MLAAIRRDYAEAVARADVTLGLSSPAFARMILSSPALIGRVREMLDQREQALGDAIAAETGTDGPQQRLVAALLASVHRVLSAEASQAQPGRAAARGDLCRAGRRRHPRVRPARAVPRQLRHPAPGTVAADPGAPGVGFSKVASTRTAVVLPAPFGPSRASTLPRSAAMSTPASAWVSPKRLVSPSASIT